jgi:tetratricopeptide (TPR) repeat protein
MAFRGDQRQSVNHLKHALSVSPNDTDTLFWLCIGHAVIGRCGEAQSWVDRLLRIDPFSPLTHMADGFVHFMSGRFKESFVSSRKSGELSPSPLTDVLCALSLLYDGQVDEALARIDQFTDLKFFLDRVVLMYLYGHQNRSAEAVELVNEDLKATARRDPQWSWHLASGYAAIGEHELALKWLDNAVDRGFMNYQMIGAYDPYITRLRGNKRYEEIVQRAKMNWENFGT